MVKASTQQQEKMILLGVTGSIAAYKSADIIRRLQEKGYRVTVMMTPEAERFISSLTLASLSGHKVYRDMFEDNESAWQMSHIQLAKQADLVLIAPATANIIGKMAARMADDLLSCTVLTTKAQVVIAPAMNEDMYQNKIVQENCVRLRQAGMKFIEPVHGKLACGVVGEGHLAEVEEIVKAVERFLK